MTNNNQSKRDRAKKPLNAPFPDSDISCCFGDTDKVPTMACIIALLSVLKGPITGRDKK